LVLIHIAKGYRVLLENHSRGKRHCSHALLLVVRNPSSSFSPVVVGSAVCLEGHPIPAIENGLDTNCISGI
jgi:hypothetical protein